MKKVSLYVLILSIIMSMVNIPVNAENTYSLIASYDFESFNSSNRNIYNTQDNTKYTLSASQYGAWEHKALDGEVNYPQKKYLKQTDKTKWAPIHTTVDEAFLNKVNDGFSFDTWISSPLTGNFVIFQLASSENEYITVFATKEASDKIVGIRVYIKAQKEDDTFVIQNYYYPMTLTADEWYHLGFKYDKNEPPKLYLNGEEKAYTTADNIEGTTPVSIPVEEQVKLKLIEGEAGGYDYYNSAAYASLNIYDETLGESSFLESFSKTKGWFEPAYNITVTDGKGEFVSQENLASVYSSGSLVPKITIDMQTIENTDLESFTKDTVKIYDITNDEYVTYTDGEAEYGKYNISCNGMKSGSYRLEIDGVKDVDGNFIRQTKQTLEFGIYLEQEPELIASYDMKDNLNKVDSSLYPLTASRFMPITDYEYEDTYRIPGVYKDDFDAGNMKDDLTYVGNSYAYGNIAGLAQKLNGAFTIDVWAYSIGKQWQVLYSIADTDAKIDYKIFRACNGYLQFNDTYKKGTETGTVKYENRSLAAISAGWKHFVMAYTPGATTQVIYINGTKYTLTATTDIPEDADFTYIPDSAKFFYNTNASRNDSRFRFSNMNIYTGATESFTQALSTKGEDNYTKNYDLKLYKDGELIRKDGLDGVLEGELTAKIATDDVSSLANAISGKVKLVKADGTEIMGTVTADTTVNVAFENVTGGQYTLVIDKQVNGRTTDYELELVVFDIPELIASYDMKDKYNKVNSELYPLSNENLVPISDYEYEDTYRISGGKYDLEKAGNTEADGYINGVAKELNGAFTFDAWIYNIGSGNTYGDQIIFSITDNKATYKMLRLCNGPLQFDDLYRKQNADGETYTDTRVVYKTPSIVKLLKGWHHIVFAYVPNAEAQIVYINGTKYTLKPDTAIPEDSEVATVSENGIFHYNSVVDRPAGTVVNGITWGNSNGGSASRFRFSNMNLYKGELGYFTDSLINKGEDAYYKNYDLKLYNNDVLVTKEALAYVPEGTLVAKIAAEDVSALSSAVSNKIKLVRADKTEISGVVTTSDKEVVVTFENVTDGDYTLIIDKSVNERDTDYELAFTVGDKPIITEAKVEITGDSVKAVATVASDISSAVLMLAIYDSENRFVGAKLSDTITNQAMETESLEFASGYTAKALLVESIATLKPIK